MVKITDIYKKYKTPRNISDHQFRVAAVANVLVDHDKRGFDEDLIITTCLLHDMGNVIKADLSIADSLLQPEGKAYWKKLQKEFIKKYGNNEDIATYEIAKELNLNSKNLKLLKAFNYKDGVKSLFGKYINLCVYADMRVTPYGVVSIQERIEDAERRYLHRNIKGIDKVYFKRNKIKWKKRQKHILSFSDLSPEDINNKSIQDKLRELRNYNIKTDGV